MRRRQSNKGVKPTKKEDNIRINEQIQADQVRLVGNEGTPEVISLQEALERAEKESLDLVEVSSQDIPVVKIVDYGKYRFDYLKKQKESRKKQKVINVKEVKLRPKIDTHDYETKRNQAIKFLEKGDKVKVTIMFRGREMAHKDIGYSLIEKFRGDVADVATADKEPHQEGPNLIMILAPQKKKN